MRWTGCGRFRRIAAVAAAFAVGSGLGVCTAVSSAARYDTVLVSTVEGSVDFGSRGPSISATGRFVAFVSDAYRYPRREVFVRDLRKKTTRLVSRASGPAGARANGNSSPPSISADGRFVAFTSTASNLHPDDRDRTDDVFVRDLRNDKTTLVSRATGPAGPKGNDTSGWSNRAATTISADGRFVAFESAASNLHPDDGESESDVFVRDLQTHSTTLVSRATGPAGATGDPSIGGFGTQNPSISGNGRFVAFSSDDTNLRPDDSDRTPDAFVRDLHADTTTFVARVLPTTNGPSRPAISADGRLVAFSSDASNLHPDDGNGHPKDVNSAPDVFVRDVHTGATTLVSRATGAAGVKGHISYEPSISADGRSVAFVSESANLHPDESPGPRGFSPEVFVRRIGPPPFVEPPRPNCRGKRATIVVVPRSGLSYGGGPDYRRDVIVGSRRADKIDSDLGDDLVCGRAGGDRIWGGWGRDLLFGQGGADRILGHRYGDVLDGGAGDDVLDAGAGRDRIRGGSGNDFIPTAGRFADRVDCGPGYDTVVVDPLDRVRHCERQRVRTRH